MQTLQKSFGEKLKTIRKSKGLTQDELAALTGNGIRQIVRIENGASFPSGKLLENLCKTLHTSPQVFFSFSQEIYTHQTDFKLQKLGNFVKITSSPPFDQVCTKIPQKNAPDFFAKIATNEKRPILVDFYAEQAFLKTQIYFPDGSSKLLPHNKLQPEIDDLIKKILSKNFETSKESITIIRLALSSTTCTQSRRRLIRELLKIDEKYTLQKTSQ